MILQLKHTCLAMQSLKELHSGHGKGLIDTIPLQFYSNFRKYIL